MPKIKTVSGAKKRFHRSGSGQIRHYPAGKSHILTKKSRKRKRRLRKSTAVDSANLKTMARCMPGS